jgi:hypothetical protein
MKNLLITTKHRGVWFAQIADGTDLTNTTVTGLQNCRMAIYWGTKNGLQELAATGPTENSKISSASGIEVLHDVTAIFSVTDQAAEKWLSI